MSDIDTFIETCTDGVHPETVAAIVEVVTDREPFVLTVLPAEGKRIQALVNDRETVIQKGIEHIEKGDQVSVGLMQVSSKYWSTHNVTIMDMLDPCTNIQVGTSLLKNAFMNGKLQNKSTGESMAYAIELYIDGNLYENGKQTAMGMFGEKIDLEEEMFKQAAWVEDPTFGRVYADKQLSKEGE